ERELGFQGVYRIAPDGGDPQLLVDDFEQPNGLCFSPDESLLYINDTPRAHIRVFDRQPDGTIGNGRMFFENIGSGVIEEGIPDGMKCDEHGNIDRKSTRLNSSHVAISYAVFCLKKKKMGELR